jgi:4-hydroxy-3-methylbut-2-enyl diphosphate reductase
MALRIEKAGEMGFCYGVRRAIEMLEKAVAGKGRVETLGAVVHNQQVLQRLADIGITVAKSVEDIKGKTIAISSHGISPEVEAVLKSRKLDIIDTTCPFVHRAQVTARRLADADFLVVIYGDANHPEVKGLLGWAGGKGVATIDSNFVSGLKRLPRRIGILSQTTQIPGHFVRFVKETIDSTFTRDSEIRIIDTICHDIRKRQVDALELAKKVDLMLVVGGRSSANTRHLADLCASITETHHIETAEDLADSWFNGKRRIGVTSGASTADQTIDGVLAKLGTLAGD